MINAIELRSNASSSYQNEYGNTLSILPNIKHINILLGENNSGKSRFMRNLVVATDSMILTDEIQQQSKHECEIYRNRIRDLVNNMSTEYSDIYIHENHDEMTVAELYAYYKTFFEGLNIKERSFRYFNIQQEVSNTFSRLYQLIMSRNTRNNKNALSDIKRIYIPVLRGIESFDIYFNIRKIDKLNSVSMNKEQRDALEEYKENARKIYKNKISAAYNINQDNIFTGEDLYIEIRNKLLGEAPGRQFIHDFESFISDNFYDGEGFTIIPLINKGYLNVKIGDSEERALHDLGDGIKQLICILYKAFELRDSEAMIFVEEPEINLHPGYQRKLIDILQQPVFDKLYFFFTTHSNHFVDRYFDYENISIYKFINVKKNNNQFQVINTPPNSVGLLNALGVNNSSVFMANATIWVEGLSDKIYLEKYLKTYIQDKNLKQFKEGVDYAFVEYSGNNVTHWAFDDNSDDERINAAAITNRAMIIVDNDDDSAQKQRRKAQLQKMFEDRYLELPVREIENTINISVLEKTLFKGESPVYKNGMERSRKQLNTKSAYVWKYIDEHYVLNKKYWNPQKKQPCENKIKFAKKICSNIETIDDLSDEAKMICSSIYSFLEKVYKDIN